jgi:TPR repeat protein
MRLSRCISFAQICLGALLGGVVVAAHADLETALRDYNNLHFQAARQEFLEMASQGRAEAQFYLGEIYEGGVGVSIDYAAALKWYRLAADQDHALAQRRLGSMYSRGLGTDKDETKAFQWYLKGARNGDVLAQFEAGLRYGKGLGTARNAVEAYKWLTIAASYGDPEALARRDDLLSGLSGADRQRAQSLARAWERTHEARHGAGSR